MSSQKLGTGQSPSLHLNHMCSIKYDECQAHSERISRPMRSNAALLSKAVRVSKRVDCIDGFIAADGFDSRKP